MSHKLYRLLCRSYILSKKAGMEQQSPPWTQGCPRPGALQTSHIRAQRSPRVSACPSLLAGKRKSRSCNQLIKSSSRFACTGNAGTYSKQKVFEESSIHTRLFWFATAKNGISLPVRVIIKKVFQTTLISKKHQNENLARRENKSQMCAAGTLMLRDRRQKVGSATTGLIQEQKNANHRIQCKYCHQRRCSFMPSCTERNNTKRYFPPLEPVHRSADSRARFCVKFKFLMTAQGKRKRKYWNKATPSRSGLGRHRLPF